MFVILVYDVNVKRVGKVLKLSRRYLNWVQNSVLEGRLTKATYKRLVTELEEIIDKKEDSVVFYLWEADNYQQRIIMGLEKGGEDWMM